MLTRLGMIGVIRDRIEELYALGRYEYVKEIMGDVDRFNFSEVSDDEVRRIWAQIVYDWGAN